MGGAFGNASELAYWQLRAFYLVNLLISFDLVRRGLEIARQGLEPALLWPVFWVDGPNFETAATAIALALPVTAILALWYHVSWWPRLLVFLAHLQFAALENSFGSINHLLHYPLWISLFLLLAPVGPRPQARAATSAHMRVLYPAFVAQAFVGLFYSLSGYHKAYSGFFPSSTGISSFHPDALPLLVLRRWQETGKEPMLGDFFVSNIELAWPAYLAVIYFELFFLVAVFRPQLHRLFGLALATFHLGVWLVLGIAFPYQPVLVALLFIWSPFTAFDQATMGQRLGQLPGIDLAVWIYRRTAREADVKSQTQSRA